MVGRGPLHLAPAACFQLGGNVVRTSYTLTMLYSRASGRASVAVSISDTLAVRLLPEEYLRHLDVLPLMLENRDGSVAMFCSDAAADCVLSSQGV